ncbi:CvpA family protein [Melioribacter sp. Ez-97]|uniref:CvpA family protein n=1 Tax=Melioribacter sp. Ez-97 TaxID=3423434 RepID=UPI003ED9490A
MNYLDYLIIVVGLIGFILGFKDGLIRKIIGITGLVLAVILTVNFSDELAIILTPVLNDDDYFAKIVAAVLIFLTTIIIFSILKRIVHPSDKVNKLINQIIGGLIGTLQIIIFLSGLFLVLDLLGYPDKQTRTESLMYERVYNIIPGVINFVVDKSSNATDIIKDFIEKTDTLNNN